MKTKIFCLVAIAFGASLSGCAIANYKTVDFNPIQKAKGRVVHRLMFERRLEAGHVLKADDLYELDYSAADQEEQDSLPASCKDALVGCKLVDEVDAADSLDIEDISKDDLKKITQKHSKGEGGSALCKHRVAFAKGYPCIDTAVSDTEGLVYLVNHDIYEGQEIGPDDLHGVAMPNDKIPQATAEARDFIVGKVSKYGMKGKGWKFSLPVYEPNDQSISNFDLANSGKCFVATRDIKASEKLKESDFKLGPDLQADGGKKELFSAIGHPSLIAGKVARRHLAKGEIIHVLDVAE